MCGMSGTAGSGCGKTSILRLIARQAMTTPYHAFVSWLDCTTLRSEEHCVHRLLFRGSGCGNTCDGKEIPSSKSSALCSRIVCLFVSEILKKLPLFLPFSSIPPSIPPPPPFLSFSFLPPLSFLSFLPPTSFVSFFCSSLLSFSSLSHLHFFLPSLLTSFIFPFFLLRSVPSFFF